MLSSLQKTGYRVRFGSGTGLTLHLGDPCVVSIVRASGLAALTLDVMGEGGIYRVPGKVRMWSGEASVVLAEARPSLSVPSLSMSSMLTQAMVSGPCQRPRIGLTRALS